MLMMLYLVSYELFWNCIGVVRFATNEVCSGKRLFKTFFVFFLQIVLL